jgi:hypothetical protein
MNRIAQPSIGRTAALVVLTAITCSSGVNGKTKGISVSNETEAAVALLRRLEKEIPLTANKLEKCLRIRLKAAAAGPDDERSLEWDGVCHFSGLTITHIRFVPPGRNIWGRLTIDLDKNRVDEKVVVKSFPGGTWVPPPPPEQGPTDALEAYLTNRSWGNVCFAFFQSGLRRILLATRGDGSQGP